MAAIYTDLTRKHRELFLPDLAMSLNNLANRLSALGRREEAADRVKKATAIYRELASKRPESVLPDLAMSLNNLASSLNDLGRSESGLPPAEESVRIYRDLARERPHAFAPSLCRSLGTLGAIQGQKNPDKAVPILSEAIEILTPFLLDLPHAHERLLNFLVARYNEVIARIPGAQPDSDLLAPVLPFIEQSPSGVAPQPN